jgi:hypothetical protein
MKVLWSAALLAVCAASLAAQAPAPAAQADRTFANELGFSYSFPADWEVVDMSATLPEAQQQAQAKAGSDAEKRGAGCIQIALSARHGSPASTVVALVLPFACLGGEMTEQDLPGMAAGAVEGAGQNFNLGEPATGAYRLGAHPVWVERLTGSVKGNMGAQFTIETVCTLVKKGAVCWRVMAGTDQALATFEQGAVTLDGDAAAALVPAEAFAKKNN